MNQNITINITLKSVFAIGIILLMLCSSILAIGFQLGSKSVSALPEGVTTAPLPVLKGGTGQSTLAGLKSSLFTGTNKQVLNGLGAPTSEITGEKIELYFSSPYIDFHQNNTTTDYTHRIIASSNALDIAAPSNEIKLNGTSILTDTRLQPNITNIADLNAFGAAESAYTDFTGMQLIRGIDITSWGDYQTDLGDVRIIGHVTSTVAAKYGNGNHITQELTVNYSGTGAGTEYLYPRKYIRTIQSGTPRAWKRTSLQ
jgi:hypothetical protein